MSVTLDSGDQRWSEAGDEIVQHLARDVQKRAKAIRGDIDVDAVHDMRTATRRLRTAIKLYASEARDDRRKSIEKELKRVARRLGSVRDLDVLLEALDEAEPRIDGRFGLSRE